MEFLCGKGNVSEALWRISGQISSSNLGHCSLPLSSEQPLYGHGDGRIVELDEEINLDVLVERMKKHLGVSSLRVAEGKNSKKIKRVGVCAGSGSGVLRGERKAEAWVTGELGHHDVLEAISRGTSVILSEHSNSERSFLFPLKEKLATILEMKTEQILISEFDKDPLIHR